MRAVVLATLVFAACSGPAPTTAVELELNYNMNRITTLSVTGVAGNSARKFGPYDVRARDVPSGETVGLIFDEADEGSGMVCVTSREGGGRIQESGCTLLTIRAGEIMGATLDLGD